MLEACNERSFPEYCCCCKSLQSCPTPCDPTDGSPPGIPVPGILQARTLEWVAISFSTAWKWKVKVKSLSRVWLLATPWTAAYQAPPSMGFSRQKYWSGINHASGLNFTVSSLSPFLLFCFLFNLHTIHLLNFFSYKIEYIYGGSDSKESACNVRDPEVGSSGWEVPWSRKWQPTQVLLPGKLHGQRSLVGYSPLGCKEPDANEQLTLTQMVEK